MSDRASEPDPASPGTGHGQAAPFGAGPLAVLERIRRPAGEVRTEERCELCAAEVADTHGHIVDLDSRGLLCACRACYLLFTQRGAARGRYQAVPDRLLSVTDFAVSMSDWEALQIPVSVAFFFYNSDLDRMAAFYPSPAGATECLLPLGAWEAVVGANRALALIEPDVEAVLIRARGGVTDCFIVPIDVCYELVGLMRKLWRGFDGGREVHEAVDTFFATIESRARPVRLSASTRAELIDD